MKKVAIITRHAIANYGSLLQAIALQTKVQELGYDAQIIDFIRTDESMGHNVFTELRQKESWNKSILKRTLYCLIRMPSSIIAELRFAKFRRKYLNLSKLYKSSEQLRSAKPIADVYMTGSDQVWGPTMDGKYEWSYFLDFCDEKDLKISYAASFGKKDISGDSKEKILTLLKKYDALCVREDTAVSLLEENGVPAKQVIDPTLLLSSIEWETLLEMKNQRPVKKKYVLVYQIHNNKELDMYATEFAKRAGLELIRVSPFLHQIIRGGRFVLAPELSKFLLYIKFAEYIVTDSFHGTVFAINFNTPLVTMLPKTGTSTRNVSILKLLGLDDCIVQSADDFSLLRKKISFDNSNKILVEERERSIELLNHCLCMKK